mgnify:CR=1 FL=1
MSNIANTIYGAIVSHTAWKKHLHNVVDAGKNESNLGQKTCELSKWFEENVKELSQYKHYPLVTELHNKFHQETDKIIQLALNGKQQQANAAVEYGSDFDKISKELVQTLIAWHDVVIGKK